jgi:hypothetical protein
MMTEQTQKLLVDFMGLWRRYVCSELYNLPFRLT